MTKAGAERRTTSGLAVEPILAMADAAARIEEVVAFLDDHPGVQVYHRNYNKAKTVTDALKEIRSAVRVARQSVSTESGLDAMDQLDEACRDVPRDLRIGKEVLRAHARRIRSSVRAVRSEVGETISTVLPASRVPEEIREEFTEDQGELQKCYKAGAWRASLMVASRLLELVVARKHWEATGVDPVRSEWTLGKTISEAERAGVLKNQPRLGAVLKMLNAYRIDSVHVTAQVYRPGPKDVEGVIALIAAVIDRLYP